MSKSRQKTPIFLRIVACCTLLVSADIFANFPQNSGEILESFYKYQYKQLYEILPLGQSDLGALLATEQKINNLERIHDRLGAGMEQMLTDKAEATRQKHSLEDFIAEAEENIDTLKKGIQLAQEQIASINAELLTLTQKIDDIGVQIKENKEQIKEYILMSYQKSASLFYEGGTSTDVLQALLVSSTDIGSSILESHTSSILGHVAESMMAKNKDLIAQQYSLRNQVKLLKDEKTHHKFRLSHYKKSEEVQVAYKNRLLDYAKSHQANLSLNYEKNRALDEKVLVEVEELREEYEKRIESFKSLNDCDTITSEVCGYIDKYYEAEKRLRDEYLGRESVQFIWPVKHIPGLSAYYRDVEYRRALNATHYGIDVPVPQGTDIMAPASGYVLYLNAPREGNYGYLAIKHPDGFITVYGHLSEVMVGRFEFVEQGQVFAKSGGTPGTPWAGNMTSGAHLHFEMYREKLVTDPLRYLDLTVFSEAQITKKYSYKYYLDRKKKDPTVDPADLKKSIWLFYLEGRNEIERQQELLATRAAKGFGDWEMWVEEAIEGKIDPAFIMCIGFSESGLGNNLTTEFNIGNVWNTDSGDRRGFASAREGIRAIVATLNGRFLGDYHQMIQLSGWWNPDGTIYASSTVNWHENMTNCLSAIKWEYVSDEFEYRIMSTDIRKYTNAMAKTSDEE